MRKPKIRKSGHLERDAGLEPNFEGGTYCRQFIAKDPNNPNVGENKNVCSGDVRLINNTGSQIVAAPWRVDVKDKKFVLQEIVGDPVSVPVGQDRMVKYVKLTAKQFLPFFDRNKDSLDRDKDLQIYVVYGRTLDDVRPNPDDLEKFPKATPETSLRVGLIGPVTAKFLPPITGMKPIPPPLPPKPAAALYKPYLTKGGGGFSVRRGGASYIYQPAFINRLF